MPMDANTPNKPTAVVFTNKARCRDCYRCVRVCPVKAIRVEGDQAHVDEDRCIACGTCVRECPQGAKAFRRESARAESLLASDGRVACSVAPSAAAVYGAAKMARLPSALRQLGFDVVSETAVGAELVAKATAEHVRRQPGARHLCSSCPAVVRYIERYRPECVGDLVPVVSPMLAHAAHLRETFGYDLDVVFIGPCVAKKAEAGRSAGIHRVNAALTFSELDEWLERACIGLDSCEESDFDEPCHTDARLFPIEGGAALTSGWSPELTSDRIVALSGFEGIQRYLDDVGPGRPKIVEPLFCPGGCVGGPGVDREQGVFSRRAEVIRFARAGKRRGESQTRLRESRPVALESRFQPNWTCRTEHFSEEQIREVLSATGKAAEEDQLNCGACGYPGCREKAIAVLQGLARPEMCIPYMRRLAEGRADHLIETSPNGIVILDEKLRILGMNPAFRRFFRCGPALIGKPISTLIDPDPFERLIAQAETSYSATVDYDRYGLVCRLMIHPLPGERRWAGFFVDITDNRTDRRRLENLREQTVLQARELLEQQIAMAETIAGALGENTARAEKLLRELVRQAEAKGEIHQP